MCFCRRERKASDLDAHNILGLEELIVGFYVADTDAERERIKNILGDIRKVVEEEVRVEGGGGRGRAPCVEHG